MKILLISANVTLSPYPIYPIGVSMIAGALTKAGHEVLQVDLLHQNTSMEAIAEEVRKFNPGLVGISVRNIDNVNLMNEQYYIQNVKDIVNRIREVTAVKVLLGGAGFSLIPDLILKETGADYGIVGEGEVLAVEFANNAANGIYPAERLISSAPRLSGAEINSALYDERLLEFYLHSGNIASIQTKRGCSYKCVYCTYPVLEGSKLRRREPRAVADDIELLRDKFKTKYIFFVDSVFNDDEGAYLEIIDEMERRNISIPWTRILQAARPKRRNRATHEENRFRCCRGRRRCGLRYYTPENGQELHFPRYRGVQRPFCAARHRYVSFLHVRRSGRDARYGPRGHQEYFEPSEVRCIHLYGHQDPT